MLGEFLRRLREAAGLTVEEVGSRLGMARGSVGKWERGETSFTAEQLGAFLEIVGASEADNSEAVRLSRLAGAAHLVSPRDTDDPAAPAVPSQPVTGCGACSNFTRSGRCVLQPVRPKVAAWRANAGRSGAAGGVAEGGCPGFADADDVTEETTAPPDGVAA